MRAEVKGIGIGLRREFAQELLLTTRQVDWLEIIPENWVCFGGERARLLTACGLRWPIVSHSVSVSVGGPDPLDLELLDAIRRLLKRFNAPWWSDHLCYSTASGAQLHDLLPLPRTAEVVEHTAKRIRAAEEHVGVPFLLENISFYAEMPGCTIDDASFLCAILEQANCGLLLDVNNVYVNSLNHSFDPRVFIDRMPMTRVREIHMAGHTHIQDVVIDTHIGPICDEVWDLYRYTLTRAGRLIPTLIEWDQDIPPLDVVLDEVDRARAHATQALANTVAIASCA